MAYTGGQSVVDVLVKEGVTKVFGVPGESYLNVMDAIYDSDKIEYVSARQEGGASYMAEGYAKASKEVGVCMATRGPGATNLSIGLHTAHQDSTPMVALIGQVERDFRDREAFQEVDFVGFFSHLCKWTVEINNADRIPELLHRAFHIARSGRPGPVLVSLPEDMLDDVVLDKSYKPYQVSKVVPDNNAVAEAAELLKNAKRPVVIAGGGVIASEATDELIQLAETLQIPVATAFRRFSAYPNIHENYIGYLGLGAPEYLQTYIKESDLVLALGTRFSQMTTNDYELLTNESQLIHVDISESTLGKVYTPTLPIVSDAKEFVTELNKIVTRNDSESRVANLKELRSEYENFSTPQLVERDDYADMNSVIDCLNKELPKDSIITSDAGNFFSWLTRYFKYDKLGKYIGPTSGAMGYGMPSAIGAKWHNPIKW